jgi:2-oxoglutarate dehydrogenase E2 component (dihydrolipoamide succinyltransferase)
VRRLAREHQVDLASVAGTGAGGRVTRDDLLRHVARPRPAPAPVVEGPLYVPPTVTPRPGDRVIPMSRRRRITAEHMTYSKRVAPHVIVVTEVDLSAVVADRARSHHAVTAYVVAATAAALRAHPALNAAVAGATIIERAAVNIGVAVDTEDGLTVPVIRDADRLDVGAIAARIRELAALARGGGLTVDHLSEGTFTVSNPGARGNLWGAAVIAQPQVGILRMGEIVKRPVVVSGPGGDAIAIHPVMVLCLSYDHRAVDGVRANDFLRAIKDRLEGYAPSA